MAGVKGRTGGARPGAGRPRKIKGTSEKVKGNYLKAARKLAKEFGMTIEESMLRMAFDKDTQDSVRASIMKSYNEAMITKAEKRDVTVTKSKGPEIRKPVRLPPKRQDPALTVVGEGG